MVKLWLFDIDGTLVNINHVHLASYKLAYRDVFRKDVPDKTIESQFGKSEYDTHISILSALGIHLDKKLIDRLTKTFELNSIRALSGLGKIEPLEGVVEFLTYLQNNHEYLGAVSGNLRLPAELILEKASLMNFFNILSFDDGTKTRERIVQHAIDEARRQKYKFGRVVVVGDTTKDVEAGKYVNAFTVSVATGSDSLLALKEKNPDIALSTLKDYKLILEAIR